MNFRLPFKISCAGSKLKLSLFQNFRYETKAWSLKQRFNSTEGHHPRGKRERSTRSYWPSEPTLEEIDRYIRGTSTRNIGRDEKSLFRGYPSSFYRKGKYNEKRLHTCITSTTNREHDAFLYVQNNYPDDKAPPPSKSKSINLEPKDEIFCDFKDSGLKLKVNNKLVATPFVSNKMPQLPANLVTTKIFVRLNQTHGNSKAPYQIEVIRTDISKNFDLQKDLQTKKLKTSQSSILALVNEPEIIPKSTLKMEEPYYYPRIKEFFKKQIGNNMNKLFTKSQATGSQVRTVKSNGQSLINFSTGNSFIKSLTVDRQSVPLLQIHDSKYCELFTPTSLPKFIQIRLKHQSNIDTDCVVPKKDLEDNCLIECSENSNRTETSGNKCLPNGCTCTQRLDKFYMHTTPKQIVYTTPTQQQRNRSFSTSSTKHSCNSGCGRKCPKDKCSYVCERQPNPKKIDCCYPRPRKVCGNRPVPPCTKTEAPYPSYNEMYRGFFEPVYTECADWHCRELQPTFQKSAKFHLIKPVKHLTPELIDPELDEMCLKDRDCKPDPTYEEQFKEYCCPHSVPSEDCPQRKRAHCQDYRLLKTPKKKEAPYKAFTDFGPQFPKRLESEEEMCNKYALRQLGGMGYKCPRPFRPFDQEQCDLRSGEPVKTGKCSKKCD